MGHGDEKVVDPQDWIGKDRCVTDQLDQAIPALIKIARTRSEENTAAVNT